MRWTLLWTLLWTIMVCGSFSAYSDTWNGDILVLLGIETEVDPGIIFVNQSILTSDTLDSLDLLAVRYCLASDDERPCVYYLKAYNSSSHRFWRVLDTTALDFSDSLELSDGALFSSIYLEFLLGGGPYGLEEYFVFQLHSDNYAFCHGLIVDSTYASGESDYQRMYLACQVQDDGTTKFDSIPQYPYGTTESVLRTPAHTDVLNPQGPPYRVNGARATDNGAVGVRVRAVGKE
ncbi:MAG TPA: hypothetical protein VLM37_10265 [Fibrobacteraceae bacterium]|nr:hypothetical protein [Fibrobacteraceae bacterium]